MYKILKKTDIKLILYIVLIATVCITICSKNSFLYCFNDWEDENAFMTVAKGWLNGLIPYKDLFEQKGPFLYLIFVIANIISNTSFIGVYFLEIISMSITLFMISKIIKLFLNNRYVYLILPIFCSIMTSSSYFFHGGCAEEFCLPYFAYGLYQLLKFFKTKEIKNKEMFISGLCAGIISMIKFNLLGFYIGFCLSIGISLLTKKATKELLKKALIFLFGMLIPIVISVVYLWLNGALKYFIDIYIIYNINNYGTKYSFFSKLFLPFFLFCSELCENKVIMILISIGIIDIFYKNKITNKKIDKILLLVTFILSFFGIYYGAVYRCYYFFFLVPYIILGLFVIYELLLIENNKNKYKITLLVSIILSVFFLLSSSNLSFMKYEKSELAQYKFAKIINETQNATLLNCGFLDGGFYMASDVLPNTRYFEWQNGYMADYESEIKKEINNNKFIYIVTMNKEGESTLDFILEKYQLVGTEKQEYENHLYYYNLYKLK